MVRILTLALLLFNFSPAAHADGILTQSEFEAILAERGKNPRDFGMEVLRICELRGVSTVGGNNLTYGRKPTTVQEYSRMEVRAAQYNSEQSEHFWSPTCDSEWHMMSSWMQTRVPVGSIMKPIVVEIEGVRHTISDRQSISLYNNCEWVSIPGTGFVARKPTCPPETE